MLMNIPECISPELMTAMMKMGHGDTIVISDGDFPAYTSNNNVIRADGIKVCEILDAILRFFPLDPFIEKPVIIMAAGESGEPDCWQTYRNVINKYNNEFHDFELIERYAFYERAKKALAVVITSEFDGNLILQKGVVNLDDLT